MTEGLKGREVTSKVGNKSYRRSRWWEKRVIEKRLRAEEEAADGEEGEREERHET